MLFTTIGQHRVFLWMAAAGVLMGVWYALLAALRRLLSAGVWLGLLADAAFGLGAAAIFCLALYTANYGQLRLYAALAAALGFGIFILGIFSPGRRCIKTLSGTVNHFIVKIRGNRWISIIFR